MVSGKIKPVENIEGEEDYDQKILDLIHSLDKGYDGNSEPFEFLDDITDYIKYEMIGGVLYEYVEREELDPGGSQIIKKNEDGSYDFVALWYNGGCCLSEILEEAISS